MRFNKDTIGLGIIGLGMGKGAFVTRDLPASTMRVTAICDTNEQRLGEVRESQAVPFATTRYQELVARDDVDVVCVYTPDALHARHVLAALDAGKHVVCTKPMVVSLDEALAVRKRVRQTGQKFLVGQTCRFIPTYIAAKSLAEQGKYGKMLYVEATYNHDLRNTFIGTPWRYQMPQDFLFGGLCHPMDLAMWIGGRIDEVSAFGIESGIDARYPRDVLDNYVVIVRFASGAIGRVIGMYNFVHPQGMPGIELTICGSEAGSWQNRVTWELKAGERRVEEIGQHLPKEHAGVDYAGHAGEVARYMLHFERCLREDLEPSPGIQEGTRVIAALEAVRESVRSRRAVQVQWDF